MRNIAIILVLMMMLAGCTELTGDSTESTEYTNQDLEGLYVSAGFGFQVDMNPDDTYVVYLLQLEDCYDTEEEANSAMEELTTDGDLVDMYGPDATLLMSDNCIFVQEPLEEPGITITDSLNTISGTPYIEMITSQETYGNFVCDNGEAIPGDWVNDGEADCPDGEDEAEGAEDSLETATTEVTTYLAADGYGTIVYPEGMLGEDSPAFCMHMAPPAAMQAFYQTVEGLDNLTDEELEDIDPEVLSTYPSIIVESFAVFDQNFADSSIPSLYGTACESSSSILVSWFGVWATSLAEGTTDGNFMMYDFSVADAAGTPTSDSGEALVYVSMDAGDDLNWADIRIQMSVDGSAFQQCTQPGMDADTGCHVTDDGDNKWAFAEEVTISEGSDDLCSGPCSIELRILNVLENTIIYDSNVNYVE